MKKLSLLLALLVASLAFSQVVILSKSPITYSQGSGPTPPPPNVPAPAQNVGYTNKTFDSTTYGTSIGQLQPFNFYGSVVQPTWYIQNSDGSLTLTYPNSTSNVGYQAAVGTASYNSGNTGKWQGKVFGGGAYVQVIVTITGTQSGDSMGLSIYDILSESEKSSIFGPGYYGIELDGPEWNVTGSTTKFGISCHNYYYVNSTTTGDANPNILLPVGSGGQGKSPTNVPSGSFASGVSATYGMLWVPATSSAQGYIKWFFNNSQTVDSSGNPTTVYYNLYNSSQAYPPTGSNVCNSIDNMQLNPVLSVTTNATTMKITSFQVWQGSGANNAQQ